MPDARRRTPPAPPLLATTPADHATSSADATHKSVGVCMGQISARDVDEAIRLRVTSDGYVC
jgi:hypothetical protein